MPDLGISSGQISAAATAVMAVVGVLTLCFTVFLAISNRRNRSEREVSRLIIPSDSDFPTIHATSGVPTFEQLIKGIEIEPKDSSRARGLYELGLERYNHYFNNRDGAIAEAKREMDALSNEMDQSEIALAEQVGIALSRTNDDEERSEIQIQYDSLQPQARIYVHHKRHELRALQLIENDLRKDVPRTDYTSVKSRIESGEATLESIMSELPLPWQDLRTMNRVQYSEPDVTKPPKREFINTMFLLPGGRVLVDRHAERDGDWLVSEEHELTVPYVTLVPLMEVSHLGDPGVPTGQYVALADKDVGTEWITELVRQGGYRDQKYILSRDGISPRQIRARYRRRQLRTRVQVLFAVDVILAVSLLVMLWRLP